MKPKNPEVGKWKTNQVEYKPRKIKPTFDMLLNKYVRQAGSRATRQYGKRPRSPSTERSHRYQESAGGFKRQITRQMMQSRLLYPGESSYWRVKEQGAKAANMERRLVPEESLVIGTHVLKLKDPVIKPAYNKPIIAIVPKATSSDHEAGSSRTEIAKSRDPKYTQPKWCPPGITKTQKRKLQRARNREKAEREADQARDAKFDSEKPTEEAIWFLL